MSTASLQTSTQRPIPLVARADLSVRDIQYLGMNYKVIKDPVALRYYRFQPEQYRVLELLDGKRNLEEIRDEFHREFPTVRLTTSDIQSLVTELHRTGLVYSNRMGQGTALVKQDRDRRRKKIWETLRNILYVKLPGWDPEKTLRLIHPYLRWMYTPWAAALCVLLMLSSWTLVLTHFSQFQSKLPEFQQFFGWPNLLYLWLTLGIAKIIHEFGHGLTCTHFGGECHEMGMLLLVLSPCLYCDVSDSWLVHNKWKRIMIGAAGMYIELVLSSFAIFGWWYSSPGLFNYLCLNLFFVSTLTTIIFNINPLLRFDGYYMLSDLLEIPNLRPKADKLMREKFAWYCLGIEARPDPFMPQRGQFWFVLFAIAASIYRWVVMCGILVFFYTFLKPYKLQSIGIMLATFSIGSVIWGIVYNLYQIISAPRIEPMNYFKIGLSTVVFGLLIAGVMMIPIPWNLEEPFVIEPYDVHHVYTTLGGRLIEPATRPGEQVKQGQVLAKLTDPEIEQKQRKLFVQRDVQLVERELQAQIPDKVQEQLAIRKLETIERQIAEFQEELDQLVIKAPAAGKVVAPPRVPEAKHDVTRTELPSYHGTPLDEKNLNCFLKPRTHLLSVAPDDRFQAVLLIDQADRNDLEEGLTVRLKLDHLSDETYYGKIIEISERHLDFAPNSLSNKQGGDLATVTDEQGRERLTSVAYQATVLIEEDASLLRSGMRGRARFTIGSRSAGQMIFRYLRRTLHFRL